MIDDHARALLIVGALLSGASGSAGFVGGRMTAPAPPAEVRFVHVRVPVAPIVAPAEAAPPAAEPAPAVSSPTAPVEVAPLPPVRPKIEDKPKPKPQLRPEKEAVAKKPRPHRPLPSCAFIRREYEAMTWAQRMAAYQRATPQEIAHGKRCLGM